MEADIKKKIEEQKRRKRQEVILGLALVSPFLIVFLLFTLIPFLMGFVFSFMRYNPYMPEQSDFVGLQNYINIFNYKNPISKLFWDSFLTMFAFDAVAVPLLIVIPLCLAYLINLQPPGYKIFRAIIYLPSIISITIVGIIFCNLFKGDSSGLVNALLGTKIDWLGGKPWAGDTLRWLVMLIASIWWQTGTNFVIFSGALRDVPKSLYEACEMDGGGRWKRIVYVTLPNIRMAVTICLFNTLIGYLNLYAQPFVLNTAENQDIFVSPMMFIQSYLMGGLTYAKQTGYFCAAAIVFGLIVMLFSIVERKVTAPRRRKIRHIRLCEEYSADKEMLYSRTPVTEEDRHDRN